MIDIANYFPITDPTLIFLVVLLVILAAPIVMGKLRIPHIIGMVLAGVMLGKYGFDILERDKSFEILGKVGLYYIMFLASLEMDMEGLKKSMRQVWTFGLLTFLIPSIMMYLVAIRILHYTPATSLLLGCIMASNTLIAYPIVTRYGLQRKPSVTLSVGGTMISLLLSLVVLAALVSAHNHDVGIWFWLIFIAKLAIYFAIVITIVPRMSRWFLRRYSDAVMQYIFVMSMLFLCAALCEAIGIQDVRRHTQFV